MPAWLDDAIIDEAGRLIGLASQERQALIFTGETLTREDIPRPRPHYGGTLTRLSMVGGRLYACGYWGLAYRRDDDGTWRLLHDDLPLRVAAGEHDRSFHDIAGPDEHEIYLAGLGGCWFFDGRDIRKLDGVPDRLNRIFVESDTAVWMCGWDGVLVRGNYRDGFRPMIATPGRQSLLSVVKYEDQVFVGSASVLWSLERGTLVPALAFMEPEPTIFGLSIAGGVLWGFGQRDIVNLKNGKWDRVPFDPPWLSEPWPTVDD